MTQETTQTFETGATTHAVNDLILFADNTRHLAECRDDLYSKYVRREISTLLELNNAFREFAQVCQDCYKLEMPDSCRHIEAMNPREIAEFATLYTNDFENWKKENA